MNISIDIYLEDWALPFRIVNNNWLSEGEAGYLDFSIQIGPLYITFDKFDEEYTA